MQQNVFHRMNHIKHVIETDFDVRHDVERPSEAILPLRWNTVMHSILKLPVPVYEEPRPVAGEIDTRRPNTRKATEMWNQGNGNGQGNGYGQPQYAQPQQYGGYQGEQDVYGRLNNTREITGGARFPFLEATGKYALCTLEEFPHSSDGPSARALFKVLECPSGRHAIGSFVVKIWKLVKPPYKPGMTTDADLFVDFCRKLKNAPQGYPMGNDIRVLMKERPEQQLARGTVIDAVGVPNKKQTWINIYWNAVQQSPQDIAAMRQRLEAEGIPSTTSAPQGQFQGAPHPAQMPQGHYPQQGQIGNPYAQPPQGPSAYPSAMPNGYGQPQPGFAQPQQAAPQGPPPGGYLVNVPTNNGGNGNQGGW